jgi:hypothetical protein
VAPDSPTARDLIFWGTASPHHVIAQNDWAGEFGRSGGSIIYPAPVTTAFFGDTDFTVATWVQPSDTCAYHRQYPYTQWNETGTAAGVERKFAFFNDVSLNQVGFSVYKAPAGEATVSRAGSLTKGRWYRLVGIHRKGSHVAFHVDAHLVGSRPWPHGVEPCDVPSRQLPWLGGVSLGGRNSHPEMYWRGLIGPTCYYTRAWTDREVAWDYHQGRGRRYGELGAPGTHGAHLRDGLVAFWPMTEEDRRNSPYLHQENLPNIVIRQDAHTGGHHLASLLGAFPLSGPGVLRRTDPVADDDRIHQVTDRSRLRNHVCQPDHALRPYWDSQSRVVSIEPGTSLESPALRGLDGRYLSLFLVSVLGESTEADPWVHISHDGVPDTGLKLFRDGGALTAKAWIGRGESTVSCDVPYPVERLVEVHFDGKELRLFANGEPRASTAIAGRFADPLDHLTLGPTQGLRELLIYNRSRP